MEKLEQKTKKQKDLEAMREKMEHMADGLGTGLDEGIIEAIVYLNLLGFITRQSCDGHGAHAPWIDFQTPAAEKEQELDALGQSVYWDFLNETSAVADKETEVKYGTDWIKSRDAINYWHEVNSRERSNDPRYSVWQEVNDRMQQDAEKLRVDLESLKNEFLESIQQSPDSLFIERGRRIEFINKVNRVEDRDVPIVGIELLKKFENFLKEKYEKS